MARNNQRTRRANRVNGFINSCLRNITNIITNFNVIVTVILGVYIFSSTETQTTLVNFLKKFKFLTLITDWAAKNLIKFTQLLVYTPSLLFVLPASQATISSIAFTILLIWLPVQTAAYDYAFLYIFSVAFFKFRSFRSRLVVLILAAIFITTQMWTLTFPK